MPGSYIFVCVYDYKNATSCIITGHDYLNTCINLKKVIFSQLFYTPTNLIKAQLFKFWARLQLFLKHTTTLFPISDNYIQAGNGELFVDQVQTNYHARLWYYNQSDVTELLIMSDPQYGRMCFKSVKIPELYILSCETGLGLRLRM